MHKSNMFRLHIACMHFFKDDHWLVSFNGSAWFQWYSPVTEFITFRSSL